MNSVYEGWQRGKAVKAGDKMTIAGVYKRIPNPDRRCWQFWKPRTVVTDELQTFIAR